MKTHQEYFSYMCGYIVDVGPTSNLVREGYILLLEKSPLQLSLGFKSYKELRLFTIL